jgi:hypothetical protein
MQSLTTTNFFAEPHAVAKANSYINRPNFECCYILDIGLKRLDCGFLALYLFINCAILQEERIDLEFG